MRQTYQRLLADPHGAVVLTAMVGLDEEDGPKKAKTKTKTKRAAPRAEQRVRLALRCAWKRP